MNFRQLTDSINQFRESTGQYPCSCILHYEDYLTLTQQENAKLYLEIETSRELLRNGIVAYFKPVPVTLIMSRVVSPGVVLCLDELRHLERLGFK